jgi:imidazolonepropionase-like amidohydrolase
MDRHEHGVVPDCWHIRAVRLPFGEQVEEWWVRDGILHDEPVFGAVDLPGGWVLPGLVDAHAHLTIDINGTGFANGSAALIGANCQAQRAAGVLAVRDAGAVPGARLDSLPPGGPRVIPSGRLFAPAGRFHDHLHDPVPAEQLVTAALEEVASGLTWVKIIADFPGPDGNWAIAPITYPIEVVRALVEAVHAAGARVMAHTSTGHVAELVRAGVDSIEHGPAITPDLLREMAARGTAWTPTLATITGYLEPLIALDGLVGDYVRGTFAQWHETIPLAEQLGVTLLAGTDEIAHGSLAREIAQLRRFGLSPASALDAASTMARDYLGLSGFRAGAPADLVTFATDPRLDPATLELPAAILLGGSLVGEVSPALVG